MTDLNNHCLISLYISGIIVLILSYIYRDYILSKNPYEYIIGIIAKIVDIFRPEKRYEAIIGIDFGSSFSGYSIIFDSVKDLGNDDNYKIISSEFIMFEEPKRGLMIGKESHGFMLNDKNVFSDKLYFRRFKKNLNPAIRNYNFVNATYPTDKILELKTLIYHYLELIKIDIYKNSMIKNLNRAKFKWIITVPALWDVKGKEIMKKAAYDAEMYDCEIILEPEASSLSIFQGKDIDKELIKKGKSFLIVDVGGYTSDFSANKIIEDHNLEQLTIPMSFVHGSNQINDEMINLVKTIIGEDKFNLCEKNNFPGYLKFLDEVEEKKLQINIVNETEDFKLEIKYFQINCEGYLSKKCEGTYKNNKIVYNNNYIYIPNKIIQEIIKNLSENILKEINFVISRMKNTPDAIFLTGGFSSNLIFQDKIKKFFDGSNSEVLFLKDPQETVMRGASIFGLNPTVIKKRIIPITIAVESYEIIEDNQPCIDKYNDTEGKIRCRAYVQFFQRGNSISTEKSIEKKIYPINEEYIDVYYAYNNILNDKNKRELGKVKLPTSEFSDIPLEKKTELIVNMKFTNYINIAITDNLNNILNISLLSYPTQEKID